MWGTLTHASAAALRPWLADKPKTIPLWTMPHQTAKRLLVPDLRRARARWLLDAPSDKPRRLRRDDDVLCFRDSAGRCADIHSMRHAYITRLGVADIPLTVA